MERQYKDSGIKWIGRIPKKWNTTAIKQLMYLYAGATPKSDNEEFWDGDIVWITPADYKTEDVFISKGRRNISTKGMESCATTLLPKNSIIFSKRAPIGLVALNGEPLCTNQGCIGCIPKKEKAYSKYYYYTLSAFTEQFELYGAGTTFKEISANNFANFLLPFPQIEEQQRIAEFLDVKCREIDGLITLQEQMIAQLTDYKQSVITEIVTKGLIPDAQLVPSGIDWIAVIPKGWKNVRFYYSNWIRGRLGWKGLKSEEYTESGYPFLSAFNIINNKLDWSDINYINQERYDESPEIKLKVGDILLVKDGAGIGKCARIDELPLGESTVNSSLAVITPKAFLNYKYLYYYLQSNSFWSIINLLLVGMGVPHLTQTNMKNIKMPLPPLEEQVVIAEYLDAKCGEIDRLIETKRQKIETLKEYKKSVIYEAVTGKTDLWDS
jgi:type I restriction enzyme S subunit